MLVRVMQLREEFQALQSLDAAPAKIIGQRIAAAFTLRQALSLPSDSTSAYRLVNG